MATKAIPSKFLIVQTPKGMLPPASAERKSPLIVELDDNQQPLEVPVDFKTVSARSTSSRAKGEPLRTTLPPNLQTTPNVSHTYRFQANSSAAVAISMANVLGAIGGICTVANSKVNTWASSFRLKSLHIWGAPTTSAAKVDVAWSAGESAQVPDEEHDATLPGGIAVTSCLRFEPPARSLAGFWLESSDSAATLFTMTVPTGSVVDLRLEYRLSNVFPGVQATVAAGTLGTVYYLALDGPSSNTLRPVGLPTTA